MIPRYSTKEMEDVWSYDNKLAKWIMVEAAALYTMGKHGSIPLDVAEGIYNFLDNYDGLDTLASRVETLEQETKHDVAAFVDIISQEMQQKGLDSRWVHYGLTSSDIVDTAFSLQIQAAIDVLSDATDKLDVLLYSLSGRYRDTVMMGRTHGMYAEPTTLGVICERWRADLEFAFEPLKEHKLYGKLSGAVGTYSHLNNNVERDVLDWLALRPLGFGSQVVSRQMHASIMSNLAILAGVVEKIAVDIRGMQRSEVGEVYESFSKSQKGSSAMPHKKNPILSENITGLARVIRGYSITAMEDIALWHERDISHSSAERIIFPDAFGLMHFMITRLHNILSHLGIDAERMKENVASTKGKWATQHILLQLIKKGMTRDEAYRLVQSVSMKADNFEAEMTHVLFQTSKFTIQEIDDCFSLKRHLANVKEMI